MLAQIGGAGEREQASATMSIDTFLVPLVQGQKLPTQKALRAVTTTSVRVPLVPYTDWVRLARRRSGSKPLRSHSPWEARREAEQPPPAVPMALRVAVMGNRELLHAFGTGAGLGFQERVLDLASTRGQARRLICPPDGIPDELERAAEEGAGRLAAEEHLLSPLVPAQGPSLEHAPSTAAKRQVVPAGAEQDSRGGRA